jgi:protein-disulfide isomerase
MKRNLPLVLIATVLVAAVIVTWLLYRSKQSGPSPFVTTSSPTPAAASPTPAVSASVPVASPTPTAKEPQSPASASVNVEEFGDYQCPPCGFLHPEMKKIEAEYGPRIHFTFHNLPLTGLHKNALNAAQAAEAARLQGSFKQMHDLIYEKQNDWKDDENARGRFTKYAQSLGLDANRFVRDMDGPEVKKRLDEDQRRADALRVNGTPTIIIEGLQLKPEVTTGDGIRKGIDLMLARKAGGQQ